MGLKKNIRKRIINSKKNVVSNFAKVGSPKQESNDESKSNSAPGNWEVQKSVSKVTDLAQLKDNILEDFKNRENKSFDKMMVIFLI